MFTQFQRKQITEPSKLYLLYIRRNMKFLVTEVKFDFDEGDIDDPITFEEQVQIIHDNLGVWEADDEDDLIEEITTASGWCIKSIDYEIQLK